MYWRLVLLACLGHLLLALGQTPTAPSSPLASLPGCAATCFFNALGDAQCDPVTQQCLCASPQFGAAAQACVATSCNVVDQLATKNATDTACGIKSRDRSARLYVNTIVLGVVTGVVVVLRLVLRLLITRAGLEADDWAVVAAFLIGLPGTVIICVGTIPNGVGRDVWTLTPDQITKFGMWFWATEIQYFLNLAVLKLTLLLFYLRIFPSQKLRWLLWGTVAFDVLFGASFVIAVLAQCTPIDFFWFRWDGEHQGHCVNINAIGWSNAAISIALDLWMLALPLSQLRALRLHWKKKVAVALMFVVGTFVTVVSVLRLGALVEFAGTANPTQDNYDVQFWSTVEINVGIICACLPAMRQLLAWLFPAAFGGTTRNGYAAGAYKAGGGAAGRYGYRGGHSYHNRYNVPRSGTWGGDKLGSQERSGSRTALRAASPSGTRSGSDTFKSGAVSIHEVWSKRSLRTDSDEVGSPVQMDEFSHDSPSTITE